jgi:hypothetical protein
MKKITFLFSILALGLMILISSCKKDESSDKSHDIFKGLDTDLEFLEAGDFEKVVIKPLVKLEDCKYVVEGTIEFYKGGNLLATIDFGEGACDNIATKTVDGETTEFNLDKTGGKPDYKKVIIEPLVKIEGCDYIVSGIIKFYKKDKWIASLDYGNGECDEWATKSWEGGSKVISLAKN